VCAFDGGKVRINPAVCLVSVALVVCAGSGVVSQSNHTYTILAWASTPDNIYGRTVSVPRSINAAGEAVGAISFAAQEEDPTAFLWQNGVITDLGTLGGPYSGASAINDSGQIVGYTYSPYSSGDTSRAVLWEQGSIVDLGPGGATDINASGQVVGSSGHAFLWQDGIMRDLGTLGGSWSSASAINDAGQVVGFSATTDGARHAFLWHGGVMSDLGPLGIAESFSNVEAINESGQIVGSARTSHNSANHAFLWHNGVLSDLGTLGGTYSGAFDINDSGEIVGYAAAAGNAPRAVLWQGGSMIDLNTVLPSGSGWVLHYAMAINNSGDIVGWGYLNSSPRAFLLTPVGIAEPSLIVDAVSFAEGGQGCWQGPFFCGGAYHDETPGNWGDAQIRPDTDVDLWYDDGGIVIGGLDGLEWVTFPINVPRSGRYAVTFRTASPIDRPQGSGVINVGIYGADGSWVGNQHVPVTGGPGEWHTYVTWKAPSTIYLPAGPQTLTMWAAGGWYNVRRMTFTFEGG
jgi:probable HAF family extracellular repeat protein